MRTENCLGTPEQFQNEKGKELPKTATPLRVASQWQMGCDSSLDTNEHRFRT